MEAAYFFVSSPRITYRSGTTLTHELEQGKLLFVMNPTDTPQTVCYRLSDLFGEDGLYQYRYDWENETAASVQDDVFIETLAPHGSALVFVTHEPLKRKPSNLWVW